MRSEHTTGTIHSLFLTISIHRLKIDVKVQLDHHYDLVFTICDGREGEVTTVIEIIVGWARSLPWTRGIIGGLVKGEAHYCSIDSTNMFSV